MSFFRFHSMLLLLKKKKKQQTGDDHFRYYEIHVYRFQKMINHILIHTSERKHHDFPTPSKFDCVRHLPI